jgi:hypothetical protein
MVLVIAVEPPNDDTSLVSGLTQLIEKHFTSKRVLPVPKVTEYEQVGIMFCCRLDENLARVQVAMRVAG